MNIEKMREEFELHYAEEFSSVLGLKPSPEEMVSMRDGDSYGSERGYLNGYWKGWQASRAAIEIELPKDRAGLFERMYGGTTAVGDELFDGSEVIHAIESLGLKVKQP